MTDEILHDVIAGLFRCHALFIGGNCLMDRLAYGTVFWNVGESDVNQFTGVIFIECSALKSCNKYFCIYSFTVSVIDDCVLKSIGCSKLRIARKQTCPDFRVDVRAAAVFEIIVEAAGYRR